MKNKIGLIFLIAITTIAFSSCLIMPTSNPRHHDHKGPPPKEHKGPKEHNDPKGGNVRINPSSVTVQAGRTVQFNAVVTSGKNNVTWRIGGAQSPRTNISPNGLLTVASNESARSITVIATSVSDPSKSARANVSVRNNDNNKDKDRGPVDLGPGRKGPQDRGPPPPPPPKGKR